MQEHNKETKANRRNKTTLRTQQQTTSLLSSIQREVPHVLRLLKEILQSPRIIFSEPEKLFLHLRRKNHAPFCVSLPFFKLSSNLTAILVKTSSRLVSCFNVILEVGCSKNLIFIGLLLFAAV